MLALVGFAVQGVRLGHGLAGFVGIVAFAVFPGLVLALSVRLGYLDQVYPDDRGERGALLLWGALCYSLGCLALHATGAPPLMLVTGATFVVSTLLAWLVNRYWKISIHAAGVGAATCLILVSMGTIAWPFCLSLPAIFWARLFLRVHTPAQVGAGAMLGAGSAISLYFFI